MTTYSLAEVAAIICGSSGGMKDPELWVRRRITCGQFKALKVGRTYRMTARQIREAIDSLQVQAATAHPGMLPVKSRRRYS